MLLSVFLAWPLTNRFAIFRIPFAPISPLAESHQFLINTFITNIQDLLGGLHIPKIYTRNYKSKSQGLKPSEKENGLTGQGYSYLFWILLVIWVYIPVVLLEDWPSKAECISNLWHSRVDELQKNEARYEAMPMGLPLIDLGPVDGWPVHCVPNIARIPELQITHSRIYILSGIVAREE